MKEEREEDDDTQPFGMWIYNRQLTFRKMAENVVIFVIALLYGYLFKMFIKITKIEMYLVWIDLSQRKQSTCLDAVSVSKIVERKTSQ